MNGSIIVLDVGKTHAKLSLFDPDGSVRAQSVHANAGPMTAGVRTLDIAGVAGWLTQGLTDFARQGPVAAIVPVAHGAAGVLLDGDRPVVALDYEAEPPRALASAYDAERDPFEATLSPRLPAGLNLGAQLYWLESLHPKIWPAGGRLLLWPQFWAWWLSGEAASEVTSLGCHSDLWRPAAAGFSDLAERRGWAARMPALRNAGTRLGPIRERLRSATGMTGEALILCGLHDSNAALYAASGQAEVAGRAFSLVSTGTWFVCLQAAGHRPFAYDSAEDMLANVDVAGRVVPTARFMGGRLYEAGLGGSMGTPSDPDLLLDVVGDAGRGADSPAHRATRAALDLAARTNRALDLIGADGPVVVEGRFAEDRALVTALATLRPDQPVYAAAGADGVRLGALRLALPDLPMAPLRRIDAPAGSSTGGDPLRRLFREH